MDDTLRLARDGTAQVSNEENNQIRLRAPDFNLRKNSREKSSSYSNAVSNASFECEIEPARYEQ